MMTMLWCSSLLIQFGIVFLVLLHACRCLFGSHCYVMHVSLKYGAHWVRLAETRDVALLNSFDLSIVSSPTHISLFLSADCFVSRVLTMKWVM